MGEPLDADELASHVSAQVLRHLQQAGIPQAARLLDIEQGLRYVRFVEQLLLDERDAIIAEATAHRDEP
jgi:hypothetical protein